MADWSTGSVAMQCHNSLSDIVVKAVNSFKDRLDRFCNDQEVKCNRKADINDTVCRRNLIKIQSYNL